MVLPRHPFLLCENPFETGVTVILLNPSTTFSTARDRPLSLGSSRYVSILIRGVSVGKRSMPPQAIFGFLLSLESVLRLPGFATRDLIRFVEEAKQQVKIFDRDQAQIKVMRSCVVIFARSRMRRLNKNSVYWPTDSAVICRFGR